MMQGERDVEKMRPEKSMAVLPDELLSGERGPEESRSCSEFEFESTDKKGDDWRSGSASFKMMVTEPVGVATEEFCEARCDCCGLIEECTKGYLERVGERYGGKWICGLCAEAVKDESRRSKKADIGTEEALNRHMSFCQQFKVYQTAPPPSEDRLICALKNLFRRGLDSPRRKKGSVFPAF